MKFEYKKPENTVEAYGETYVIPTKTAAVVDAVAAAQSDINAAKTAVEQVKAIKRGIAVFIGEDETERIFKGDADIDTDEISAFWLCLNQESNKATQAVIDKYTPKKEIRVPSNPKK